MIEESLLKSNFIGRDGFRWWIGQIPPGESLGNQNKGEGWGNRYKVRIMGYHPYSKDDLDDDDLPWAGCLLPATSGTGASNFAESVKYRPGDVVVGFFMDGDNAQIPMIMGAFGRTAQVPQGQPSDKFGFIPFTGYTSGIPAPEGTLEPDESNEQNSDSQPTPTSLSSKQTEKVNAASGQTKIPASKADGQTITPADGCDDNFLGEVTTVLENFLGIVGEGVDFFQDIATVTKKIQRLSNNAVSAMMNGLYNLLIPLISRGLDDLYKALEKSIGKLKAIEKIKALVPAVKALEEQLGCLPGKIIDGLGATIKNKIEATVNEIVNFGTCVVEQFAGDLLDDITDQISSGLDSFIGALSPILEFVNINIRNLLTSTINTLNSIAGFFDCNQDKGKCSGRVKKWTLGYGAERTFDLNKTYDNVMKNINLRNAAKLANIDLPEDLQNKSIYTKPNCAEPLFCSGPKVNIFGGDGVGGFGRAILGDFVNNTSGLSDVTSNVTRTASIIGVEITDPGKNYSYKEPLISFEDSCGLGYGAVAQLTYNEDGEIIFNGMLSVGENYPAVGTITIPGEDDDDGGGGLGVINSPISSEEIEVGVIDVVIDDPGDDYDPVETEVIDDIGTPYNVVVNDDGNIISVKPINIVRTTRLPKLKATIGTGAILRPIIGRIPEAPPGQNVIEVIDCVT